MIKCYGMLWNLNRLHYGKDAVVKAGLRPVFTQENKHRIGLDFFPSCIIHTARPTETENWYRKPMRRFNFVPIPCLFSCVEIGLYTLQNSEFYYLGE